MKFGNGLRFDRAECGGALGDLGTFIPLLVGMVNRCGLQLGPALFCAGLMNVISGLIFRIPMPVQPMKAIAAIAIAEKWEATQIMVAGLGTSVVLLLLALTGLIDWLNRTIPKSVVRGLQLALGLKLLIGGFDLIAMSSIDHESLSQRLFGWDGVGMGVLCAGLVLVFYFSKRVPGALLVFGVGLVSLFASQPELLAQTQLGFAWSWPEMPWGNDWSIGLRGAVPQIPLTTLNSVIAVCALSIDLFPKRPARPRRVAISVALMNLVCCPMGAMPMCHGSGGLAAQYRFGARTGGSVVVLGVAKMTLALLFGGSLLIWLQEYPKSVLGVLLLFSGLELALVCRDQTTRMNFFVMLITAGACLALDTAIGFAVGWIVATLLIRGVFRIDPPPTGDASP
ncbi:MAG: putative sulfate/molybdate transporter [Planctomycetes bacterium]|nr:putative sulfate/molybdate transporter [Planctomycetota bacterium]